MPRISELPPVSSGPLNGDELVPIVQGGVTVQVPASAFGDLATGTVTSVNGQTGAVTLAASNVGALSDPSLLSGISGITGAEQTTAEQDGVQVQVTLQQIADLAAASKGIGFNYTSDANNTADADPGNGLLRWNNATQTSATQLFIDDQTSTDSVSLVTMLNALGQGFLWIQQADVELRWQMWKFTSITAASGYHKIAVSLMASGAAIQNNKNIHVTFFDVGTPDPSIESGVSALGGSEILTVKQSGNFVQATARQIADLALGVGNVLWNNAIQLISALSSTSGLDGDEHMVVEKGSTFLQVPSLSVAKLVTHVVNIFNRNQSVSPLPLTDGATINTDASLSNVFKVTLGGNRTLANPTNLTDGMVLNWVLRQDGTGGRTLAYGSKFKWAGGTAPTLTTTAGAVCLISSLYDAGNDILISSSVLDAR